MEQFDCRACGACCIAAPHADPAKHIEISERDVLRLAPRTRKINVITDVVGEGEAAEQHFYLRTGVPLQLIRTCSLLEGCIGDCKCSVYNQRPQACRDLEPGSQACLKARKEIGL